VVSWTLLNFWLGGVQDTAKFWLSGVQVTAKFWLSGSSHTAEFFTLHSDIANFWLSNVNDTANGSDLSVSVILLSDKYQTHLILDLSDTKPIWFWTYLIPVRNPSETKHVIPKYKSFLIPKLSYTKLWYRTYLISTYQIWNLSETEPYCFWTHQIPSSRQWRGMYASRPTHLWRTSVHLLFKLWDDRPPLSCYALWQNWQQNKSIPVPSPYPSFWWPPTLLSMLCGEIGNETVPPQSPPRSLRYPHRPPVAKFSPNSDTNTPPSIRYQSTPLSKLWGDFNRPPLFFPPSAPGMTGKTMLAGAVMTCRSVSDKISIWKVQLIVNYYVLFLIIRYLINLISDEFSFRTFPFLISSVSVKSIDWGVSTTLLSSYLWCQQSCRVLT
jgi:hypothetical protein